jgi:FlaA1/EpsC-like NDP-sugar epimerase
VDYALNQAGSGDIIIPKMRSVCLRDIIELFQGARVQIVGKRPGEKMHETLYVRGEINTGYETDQYYVLNRNAAHVLMMDHIDSTQVPRVDPRQLHQWFERVRKQAA